jgi:hypothetical protein
MVKIKLVYPLIEPFSPYDIQHSYIVTGWVFCRKPLHKPAVSPHKIKDTCLFSRTAVTRDLDFTQLEKKLFMEDKFENSPHPSLKVAASFYPVFRVFNSKAAFHLIPQHQIMFIVQDNDIPTGNPHEIAGVRINLAISVHVGIGIKPFQDLFDALGHACLLKKSLFNLKVDC